MTEQAAAYPDRATRDEVAAILAEAFPGTDQRVYWYDDGAVLRLGEFVAIYIGASSGSLEWTGTALWSTHGGQGYVDVARHVAKNARSTTMDCFQVLAARAHAEFSLALGFDPSTGETVGASLTVPTAAMPSRVTDADRAALAEVREMLRSTDALLARIHEEYGI